MNEASALDIQLIDGLNGTPALDLAVRGWADCVERGLGDGTLNVHASLKAFLAYAQNGREMLPVGVVTWDYGDIEKRVWIYQSYVLPEFRGRGIYGAMWQKLVARAVELKAVSIQSGTHVQNTAMRTIAKKQGRYEETVILRFNLSI